MPADSSTPVSALTDLARRADGPTVDQIWTALLAGERQQALQNYLASDKANRQILIAAAATLPALRAFRKQTIQQMPDGKLLDVVGKAAKVPAGMLHDILLALHLKGRTAMLESFLDILGVAHEHGVINDSDAIGPALKGARLSNAAARLFEQYPARDVLIYLLTLLAMDPESWGELKSLVAERADLGN